jgi:Recombination endonuclease VII
MPALKASVNAVIGNSQRRGMGTIEEKVCSKCHKQKSVKLFNKSTSPDGYHRWCNACRSDYNKTRYVSDTHLARSKNLKRMYGITPGQYQQMFQDQNGVCAACGQPETAIDARTGKVSNLAVDPNHTTGEVRALLCRGCNTAYGQLNEDPERIRLLLKYAEKHR